MCVVVPFGTRCAAVDLAWLILLYHPGGEGLPLPSIPRTQFGLQPPLFNRTDVCQSSKPSQRSEFKANRKATLVYQRNPRFLLVLRAYQGKGEVLVPFARLRKDMQVPQVIRQLCSHPDDADWGKDMLLLRLGCGCLRIENK